MSNNGWQCFELQKILLNGRQVLATKINGSPIYIREVAGEPKLFVKYSDSGEVKENLGLLPKGWRKYLSG